MNTERESFNWLPSALPSKLVLIDTPLQALTTAPDLDLRDLAAHGGHADKAVTWQGHTLRAFVSKDDPFTPASVVLPLDELIEVRIDALLNLVAYLRRRKMRSESFKLTSARRARLIASLRALDGRLDGASYREIAAALFGAAVVHESGWKTHDIRDRMIRMVRYGEAMMRGGYRRLLLHPYRRAR